ncbi:hypothetical protein AYK24_00570 [Thermoplasmatales archaeon SG8-52-4]|nr:MAG: hypothetical protein AYK24_00570 [Thermoplasmatales archaeon SG8-52-4]
MGQHKFVKNPVVKLVEDHIRKFCKIRNFKTRQYIIRKLSMTLANIAKAELGRQQEEPAQDMLLDLVGQYLSRLHAGLCIHDKRQDGYVLLNTEISKMEKKHQYPQELCGSCISPRVCKLKSAIMNNEQIAGIFINVKQFM